MCTLENRVWRAGGLASSCPCLPIFCFPSNRKVAHYVKSVSNPVLKLAFEKQNLVYTGRGNMLLNWLDHKSKKKMNRNKIKTKQSAQYCQLKL